MNLRRTSLLFLIGVLFVLSLLLTLCVESVKAENENALITEAQSSINQAFTNVLAAEQSGGDITDLMLKLNNAGARYITVIPKSTTMFLILPHSDSP